MVSELGSKGVAMEVTQSLWPSRVPRRERDSAMIEDLSKSGSQLAQGGLQGGL